MHVFFQPARLSDKEVHRHYLDTIASPVVLATHRDLLDPATRNTLETRFADGTARLWGVTPGKNGANVTKAHKISPGDRVFFSGDKRTYLSGIVVTTFHNPALAKRLWSTNDQGQTWEYMYAIDSVRGHDIAIDEIRRLLGWNPNRNIQNLTHLSDLEGNLLLELLGLDDVLPLKPSDSLTHLDHEPVSFDGPLEIEATLKRRGEQRHLKQYLLGRSDACALCGRVLPQGFLIAAHIKKRAHCDENERRDLGHVGMLACVLGCDSLYESGHITVDPGGHIRISPEVDDSPHVAEHVRTYLANRTTTWWTPKREPYFAWHRSHTYRRAPVS